jgi:hypothetical protein
MAALQHFSIRNAWVTTCPIHGQANGSHFSRCDRQRNVIRSRSMLCQQRRRDCPVWAVENSHLPTAESRVSLSFLSSYSSVVISPAA